LERKSHDGGVAGWHRLSTAMRRSSAILAWRGERYIQRGGGRILQCKRIDARTASVKINHVHLQIRIHAYLVRYLQCPCDYTRAHQLYLERGMRRRGGASLARGHVSSTTCHVPLLLLLPATSFKNAVEGIKKRICGACLRRLRKLGSSGSVCVCVCVYYHLQYINTNNLSM
jgi:hypothetical protein